MRRNFLTRLTYHFTEGALMITSALSALGALLVIVCIVFDMKPYVRLGDNSIFGFTSFSQGMPVQVKLHDNIPDTSLLLKYRTQHGGSGSIHYNSRKDALFADRSFRFQSLQPSDTIYYSDTILANYTYNHWKEASFPEIRSVDLSEATVYVRPERLGEKLIFALPFILNGLLLSWCTWHLYMILLFVKRGHPFGSSNAQRLMKIGHAIVAVQVLFFLMSFFHPYTGNVRVDFASTIPQFRMPIQFNGRLESPFEIAWLIAGLLILIFANAFKKGDVLQREVDLTA